MTNIFGTPKKVSRKKKLFSIAVEALEKNGWKVERVPGNGKSSVRRITKDSESKVAAIRTTQDTWIAFPRIENDENWRTLDEVDVVVPVSVDDRDDPKFAKVHLIDGDEMRARFNRAYQARLKAGHKIPIGRGVWVSLYFPEAEDPISHVGAGAGLEFPPIATVPLSSDFSINPNEQDTSKDEVSAPMTQVREEAPLTIGEAKRRLAATFGVDPGNIRITVEG